MSSIHEDVTDYLYLLSATQCSGKVFFIRYESPFAKIAQQEIVPESTIVLFPSLPINFFKDPSFLAMKKFDTRRESRLEIWGTVISQHFSC
jgi:hypothetical protein